jgi:hypothetical protein
MVVKKRKFQARCINNKWRDFGNHTGFQWVDCIHRHLVVGEYYNFEKTSYGNFDLVINGKTHIGTGYHFSVGDGYLNEYSDFYKFFSTIEEQRDMKLRSMGIN